VTAPPEIQALASQIPMGPPKFITISNIYDADTATTFTITFDSDQAFIANVQYWAGSMPAANNQAPLGTVIDAAATTHHVLTVTPAAGSGGKVFAFQINVDPTDVTGLTLRPYNGVTQLYGARPASLSVPVRFYAFGGNPPAPSGGTGGQGGGTGNWNQYTWAQYNPKGTTYPTP